MQNRGINKVNQLVESVESMLGSEVNTGRVPDPLRSIMWRWWVCQEEERWRVVG